LVVVFVVVVAAEVVAAGCARPVDDGALDDAALSVELRFVLRASFFAAAAARPAAE